MRTKEPMTDAQVRDAIGTARAALASAAARGYPTMREINLVASSAVSLAEEIARVRGV